MHMFPRATHAALVHAFAFTCVNKRLRSKCIMGTQKSTTRRRGRVTRGEQERGREGDLCTTKGGVGADGGGARERARKR